ncbi:MAG: hypothetical protein WC341_05690, partial [Bacteroidales bacterium]
MKKAIILLARLTPKTHNKISQILDSDKNVDIFTNQLLPDYFEHFSIYPFEIDAIQKKNINYDSIHKIKLFESKLIQNKSVTTFFYLNNTSLWHYQKFRIYFQFRNFNYKQAAINAVCQNHDEVHLLDESTELFNDWNLPDNLTIHKIPTNQKKAGINLITGLNYALFFFIRAFIGFFQQWKSKGFEHMVIDHAQKQHCIVPKTQLLKPDNYNLCYLFEKLNSKFVILDDVDVVKINNKNTFRTNQHRILKTDHRKYLYGEFILMKGLLSLKTWKSFKTIRSQYVTAINNLSQAKLNPSEKTILNYFIALKKTNLFFLFKNLAYFSFFYKKQIKTISTIDENSPRIKSILDAAKKSGIKTIGIQHGNIHDLHPAYLYSDRDHMMKIPTDYTLVWGKEWQHFLETKGHYPSESLVVTGQIRTDIIPELQRKAINKADQNLAIARKKVLFASQPQRDPELRYKAAFDMFTAVKNLENVILTVKLQ